NHMRILLVAAHHDVLRTCLHVLKEAGLNAVAMDSSALALMRAVPTTVVEGAVAGLEVLVSIGAELTTVAVRQEGVPRFIRTLTVGGSKLTAGIASTLHLEMAAAERLKRGAVPGETPQLAQARRASNGDVRDLAEDVRATIDFFASQAEGDHIERLLLTGGASQTEGLASAIGGNLPLQVMQIAPFATFDTSRCGLDAEELDRAGAGATTAIGLALWAHDAPLIRLSILPEEVAQARHARRMLRTAVASIVAVTGLLALAGAGKVLQVRSAQHKAHEAENQVATLTAEQTLLQARTAVHGEMLARAQLDVNALKGDVDWDRVLGQLGGLMPANVRILTFSANRNTSTTGGGGGTVTFAVTGKGDDHTAATWLRALQKDPDLAGSWVRSITVAQPGGDNVNFSSSATLTTTAQSNRSQEAKP
ncbi:MAG TPA: pilus assembly protein PilM, partial [Acidimicrobiales bacterium]|nr:pilus assembly protein PilM [Acidimicrobiales bacterium]